MPVLFLYTLLQYRIGTSYLGVTIETLALPGGGGLISKGGGAVFYFIYNSVIPLYPPAHDDNRKPARVPHNQRPSTGRNGVGI